jgi:hypothetical protein
MLLVFIAALGIMSTSSSDIAKPFFTSLQTKGYAGQARFRDDLSDKSKAGRVISLNGN